MPIAVIAQLLAAEPAASQSVAHQTPWYAPRTGALVMMFGNGAVSPALRLGWEVDLVDQPRNQLVIGLQLGAAYALNFNFWQYVAVLGLGYRMQRESGFFWGFDVGAGPAIFGNQRERHVLPYIEGRLNLGWRVNAVTISLCGGYAQWIAQDRSSPMYLNLGGPFVGVLLGWK